MGKAMTAQARAIELERIYTNKEFETMPEFDENFELVDGRLVEGEMPGHEHSLIADIIREHYPDFDPTKTKGQMLQEISVTLDPGNTLTPDVAYWRAEHKIKGRVAGAAPRPDLAIEVLSPRDVKSKNRQEEINVKIRKYLAAGVSLVWVINPEQQVVEVYQPGQTTPIETLGIDQELDGKQVMPGFKLKVAKLFE